MQSLASLNILHLRNGAVFNKRYFADNGRVYIGTKDGKLRLEDSASETSFSPTSTIQENNVQDAIENLSSGSNIGSLLTDTATIDLNYNSVVPASITADLKNTTVTAGVYGSAILSPQITIDAQGRITNAVDVTISIAPGAIALATNHILVGSAGNLATDVAMSGEASIVASGALTLSNSAVIGKVLTGYISGAGVVAATDSILQAIQKLNGNITAIPVAVTTLSAIGAAPNANGATITGAVLNLEPASISFGGVVTTIAQGFTGAKTFNDTTSVINTVGTVDALNVTHTVTSGTANNAGISNSVTHTPSSNINLFGIRNDVTFSGSQTLTDVNQGAVGARGTITFNGSNVITNASVWAALGQQTGTATITNLSGFRARNNTNSGGTVTNSFGFRADEQTGGSVLNAGFYGLVSAASTSWNCYMVGTAQNYFGGKVGIGQLLPTASLHIKAGTATAATAPIKLTSGIAMATPEDGSMEYDTSHLYFTIGATRYQLDQQGGGGGLVITESEIDFGSTPVKEKSFVITDAGISGASKIMVSPSGNTATGRVGNDYSWETINFSASSGTGDFTLYANCSNGSLVGRRKIYYTFS